MALHGEPCLRACVAAFIMHKHCLSPSMRCLSAPRWSAGEGAVGLQISCSMHSHLDVMHGMAVILYGPFRHALAISMMQTDHHYCDLLLHSNPQEEPSSSLHHANHS